MLMKLLFKKILPALVTAALVVLAALWLYGFCGVKFGWIGVGDYNSLNAISHHGAETAGGAVAATQNSLGL